ncbi:MAG: hypothetical protein HY701_10085, partial [Gemmatimonadetes bacterium]|nr:hypothetical protein [Gemmatimonadota bacterium]
MIQRFRPNGTRSSRPRCRLPNLAAVLAAYLVLTSSTPLAAQTRTFDLLTADVNDIQAAVAAGALTYERLVQLYLNRIAAYDKNGPRLNA